MVKHVDNVSSDAIDVVVVGAGLAGLTAARALHRAGKRVSVLEARDRVGGRTLSHKLANGDVVELGAQWLGPGQERLAALVREFSLHTWTQFSDGKKVLALGDKLSTYKSDIPSLSVFGLVELQRGIWKLDRMMKKISLQDPMRAPDAAELDAKTVEEWKRENLHNDGARALLDIAVQAIFACEPAQLSLLHFLFYLHSGKGLMNLSTIKNGAQETRCTEGWQEVSIRLAKSLEGRVRLSSPVRRIEQDGTGATVFFDDGNGGTHQVRCKYVALTVPPALAQRIDYAPKLPAIRDHLTQRFAMGSVAKCVAIYDRAFWRERGYSGEALATTGPVRIAFDDSNQTASHPALVGFVLGGGVASWGAQSAETRRAEVLKCFARFWGEEALRPVDYVERDWTEEEWSCGCYAGYLPPGALTYFGRALREPVGRIHFGGTETAREWNGYMDGAIESGERVAQEIAAAPDLHTATT